jgi:hypothetical protein
MKMWPKELFFLGLQVKCIKDYKFIRQISKIFDEAQLQQAECNSHTMKQKVLGVQNPFSKGFWPPEAPHGA